MDKDKLTQRMERALEAYSKPLILPQPSGHWIGARGARELLWNEAGADKHSRSAERALARRALAIPMMVDLWRYAWEPQEGLSRFDLVEDEPDNSDWSAQPSRLAFERRLGALEHIGDDPTDYLLTGNGLVSACWISGDFEVVLDGDFRRETVHLIGLKFDEVALRRAFSLPEMSAQSSGNASISDIAATVDSPLPIKNEGGRPAAKHGDVIAATALRLAALPVDALRRYTVESLADELIGDYSACGEAPPSQRNRALFAAGILRVLRSRET